jgi:glutaredoxin
MAIIRWLLGSLILFMNWAFAPKAIRRAAKAQAAIDEKTNSLTLYQYKACPFCVKVRRVMKRQSLNIATRDAKRSAAAKRELIAGGGVLKVPCLRIEDGGDVSWLYESENIIEYLESRFSTAGQNAVAA